jgi:hypothetical protein
VSSVICASIRPRNTDDRRYDVTPDDGRDERLRRLDVFVGEWRLDAPAFPLPPELAGDARTTFEWVLDGAFLIQRSSVPLAEAPDGLCVVGLDAGDGYTQHYFDSRGIARIYRMTFDGHSWTLERDAADFTPLDFHQRWLAAVSDDGATIEGRWESSPDGAAWTLDFELTYQQLS